MSRTAACYLVYLTVSVYVTVIVGRRLHRQGCPFLNEIFAGREAAGRAINDLLLTGYYLVNIALDLLLLRGGVQVTDWLAGGEWLSIRLGVVLTTLGVMHFLNVTVLLAMQWYLGRRVRPGLTSRLEPAHR